jgi:hypothetical protein
MIWDLVALNSTPSLALHEEPEVAIGTMGIGLDYGGFFLDVLDPPDVAGIVAAFPRLRMKDRFSDACCRLVKAKPETSHDNFLRDFGERFVPGYKPLSTVDLLISAAETVFDKGGHIADAGIQSRVRRFVEGFSEFVRTQSR